MGYPRMGTTPLIDGQRGESHRSRLTLGASPECVGDVPSVLLQWAIALPPDGGSAIALADKNQVIGKGFPPACLEAGVFLSKNQP